MPLSATPRAAHKRHVDVPGVLPVPERHVLRRRRDELLRRGALRVGGGLLEHVPPRIEGSSVLVIIVVEVGRKRGCDADRALRDVRPVRERERLERLAHACHWAQASDMFGARERRACGGCRRTWDDTVVALAFAQEAVGHDELAHRVLRPALLSDGGLGFLSQRRDPVGARGEMVECMREALLDHTPYQRRILEERQKRTLDEVLIAAMFTNIVISTTCSMGSFRSTRASMIH